MSLPFRTAFFVLRACKIQGWNLIENSIPKENFSWAICNSSDDLEDRYSDWNSGDGFGSSDSTYALKYFLDSLILNNNLNDKLKTDFTPSLSIVEIVK